MIMSFALLGRRKSMRLTQFLLFFTFFATHGAVNAAVVTGLYEVRMPVVGKSSAERQDSLRKAFEELLVRITGQSNIAQQPEGVALLDKTAQFIRQYRYELQNQPKYGRPSIAIGAAPEILPSTKNEQTLWVQFDEVAVRDAITQAKLPLWGATRPSTLLWVAVQDFDQRFLVDANQLSDAADAIKLAARQRGLPVVLPTGDSQDQSRINITDIWGDFADQVLDASLRYGTEAILTGRVGVDPFGTWQSRWTLYHDGTTASWNSEQRDLNASIRDGLGGAADRLAMKYASRRTVGHIAEYFMEIQNNGRVEDYVRATAYLRSVAAINKYQLVQVAENYVLYRVLLNGDRDNLEQAIGLGQTLLPARVPFLTGENILTYQLAP